MALLQESRGHLLCRPLNSSESKIMILCWLSVNKIPRTASVNVSQNAIKSITTCAIIWFLYSHTLCLLLYHQLALTKSLALFNNLRSDNLQHIHPMTHKLTTEKLVLYCYHPRVQHGLKLDLNFWTRC